MNLKGKLALYENNENKISNILKLNMKTKQKGRFGTIQFVRHPYLCRLATIESILGELWKRRSNNDHKESQQLELEGRLV